MKLPLLFPKILIQHHLKEAKILKDIIPYYMLKKFIKGEEEQNDQEGRD